MTNETDKLAHAREQGQAQFNSIKELVADLDGWRAAAIEAGWEEYRDPYGVWSWRNDSNGTTFTGTAEDLCEANGLKPTYRQYEEARQRIEDDALSVGVRSDWHTPGTEAQKPTHYQILLCTGGPAVRIVGKLDQYCQPETARMQIQDWFTPWTNIRPQVGPDNYDSEPILLAYASVFWFGE